ncbi:MAG: tetratricopeptide repeat protein [Rhodothermales bacterium]
MRALISFKPLGGMASLVLICVAGLLSACSSDEIDAETAYFLSEAQQAFEQESYNIALAFTDSAYVKNPARAETFFMRGRIYTELARFNLADDAYAQALALDDGIQGAWLNRGNLAIRKGELKQALSMYNTEASSHPSSIVYLQMGRAYQDIGIADSARWAYENALAMDSSRASTFMRLGQLLGEQGDLEPAIKYSRRGVVLEPDNLNYKYALGALLNSKGDHEEAVEYLKPFADASPWHYWGHYNLGQAFQKLNKTEEAEHYLTKAEALQETQTEMDHWQMMAESNPQHLMLWLRFGYALRRAGNTTDAERAERIAYALAPDYLEGTFTDSTALRGHHQAVVSIAKGELEEGIEIYKGLLRNNPQDKSLWLNLGVAYATYGRIVQARQCWVTALNYDDTYLRARRYMEDLDKAFYDAEEPGNG